MKKALILAALILPIRAYAAVPIKNDTVLNGVQIATSATAGASVSPYQLMIDLAQADSASFQMTYTCVKGQAKIQRSNDGVNFVDFDVTGASITFANSNALATTVSFSAVGSYQLQLAANDGQVTTVSSINVTVAAPPNISIQHLSSALQLSWPTGGGNWQLQFV